MLGQFSSDIFKVRFIKFKEKIIGDGLQSTEKNALSMEVVHIKYFAVGSSVRLWKDARLPDFSRSSVMRTTFHILNLFYKYEEKQTTVCCG